jgi:hypothetical protein
MRKPEKERSEGYGGVLILYKKVISNLTLPAWVFRGIDVIFFEFSNNK